jgi:hypothetical protein
MLSPTAYGALASAKKERRIFNRFGFGNRKVLFSRGQLRNRPMPLPGDHPRQLQ